MAFLHHHHAAIALCLALNACSYRDLSPPSDGERRGRTPASPVASGGGTAQGGDGAGEPSPGSRRNVIIVIGDGMQLAHEIATSRYLYGDDRALSFHDFPAQSFVTTWDVNVYDSRASALGTAPYAPLDFDPSIGYAPEIGGGAPYPILADTPERRDYFLLGLAPDSASTATAMSTGVKTDSTKIAWSPGAGGSPLETSAQKLRRLHGMAIGYVTTVRLSHATPAGWFAHNVVRSDGAGIAREILSETRPEVVIGAGYVDPAEIGAAKGSGAWVVAEPIAGQNGNRVILDAARQARSANKALLGLFGGPEGDAHFASPAPLDRPGAPALSRASEQDPELGAAAVAALEVLSADPDGFFLLVEQGEIDWANHSMNFSRMIGCVSDLDAGVRSIVEFVERPGDAVDWTNTTLIVTADHANSYLRLERPLGRGDLPTQIGAGGIGAYPDGDVTYGSGSHTNELVTLYVKGAASGLVETLPRPYPGLSIIDDTAIYELTMEAAER